MNRSRPLRQQGFGLLIFVIIVATIAFGLVVGYSSVLTRQTANQVPARDEAYLTAAMAQAAASWREAAFWLDELSPSNAFTVDDLLKNANVQLQYGAQAALSDVLMAEGVSYRTLVIYMPSDSDAVNPPDLTAFQTTGEFSPCTNPSAYCAPRLYKTYSSFDLQKELAKEAQARLAKVAFKAQSYFKARMLLEPERNVSVNYFRKPLGECVSASNDLGCLDTYQPLAIHDTAGGYSTSEVAQHLGLTAEELFSPWGPPIEASNLEDSETSAPPYTMSFRAANPWGGYFVVKATQAL